MVKFNIYNKLGYYYTKVIIYDSVKELREGADDWDKRRGYHDDNEDILGCHNGYIRYRIDEGKEIRKRDIGIIRLSKTHLQLQIVSHEVGHAAFQHYRTSLGTENVYTGTNDNADFGNGCDELEESFLHIYCQLLSDMSRKLFKYGLWK